jgi:hypothetical protein
METRKIVYRPLAAAIVIAFTSPLYLIGQDETPVSSRILSWSDADQTAWINSYVFDGMPNSDALGILVLNKSALTLPILEKKIEEIVRSSSPRLLFRNPSTDPQRVAGLAASLIAYAGDEWALREESKLMKIDDQRFGDLVNRTLFTALNRGNPFTLAYRGFEIGDPAVDKRIVAWAEKVFAYKDETNHVMTRQWWAEAIVEKNGGVPTATQWNNDPIASRLNPTEDAALHDEMLRLTAETVRKRAKQ